MEFYFCPFHGEQLVVKDVVTDNEHQVTDILSCKEGCEWEFDVWLHEEEKTSDVYITLL